MQRPLRERAEDARLRTGLSFSKARLRRAASGRLGVLQRPEGRVWLRSGVEYLPCYRERRGVHRRQPGSVHPGLLHRAAARLVCWLPE